MDLNYLAVLVAVVAVFVVSGAYYTIMGSRLAALSPAWAERQPVWKTAQEPLRILVTALVVAGLIRLLELDDPGEALLLALALWLAFPVVLLSGSVIHESVPVRLAAIHAGDWLLKLIIICLIVTLWR